MYQPMSVLHDHNDSPESGSKASTLPCEATTNSCRPEAAVTTSGVFHASRIPSARHFSSPVLRSNATNDSLSTLALMKTRSLYSTGEAAVPQPLVFEPTSVCQSWFPS